MMKTLSLLTVPTDNINKIGIYIMKTTKLNANKLPSAVENFIRTENKGRVRGWKTWVRIKEISDFFNISVDDTISMVEDNDNLNLIIACKEHGMIMDIHNKEDYVVEYVGEDFLYDE